MLSNELKRLRSLHKMTQAELAQKVGFSQQAIARWETGRSTPDPNTLIKLSKIFDVTVDELIGNKKPSGGYYLNPDTARLAQEIHDNPQYKVLFDATKHLNPESIKEVMKFIDYQKSKEGVD